jgi:hypothetical protein
MATAQACKKIESDLDVARGRRDAETIFTAGRRRADQKVEALEKKYKACRKANTERAGILYAKGLARAAADAGVKFALKPDFDKKSGLFKTDDVVRKALKVKKDTDTVAAGKKFARKHDLDEAAQTAAAISVLETALKNTTGGFIAAQVAATIAGLVLTVLSLGAYAAVAGATGAALQGGQQVTTAMIKKDLAVANERYQRALDKRSKKSEAKEAAEQAKAEEQAAEAMLEEAEQRKKTALTTGEPEPWHTRKEVIGAGLLLTAAVFGYALSRRS